MTRFSTRHVVGVVALFAIGFAAVYGYAPDLLPPAVQTTLAAATADLDIRTSFLLAGTIVAIVGLFSSWVWRTEPRAGDWQDESVEVAGRNVSVAGSTLTHTFEDWDGDGSALVASRNDRLKRSLRLILIETYRRQWGSDDPSVWIDRGDWTDDRLAGAFISTAETIDYPLTHRLYAWLYPERAYRRRARRALRAVEAVCVSHYADCDSPERKPLPLDRPRALSRRLTGGDRE